MHRPLLRSATLALLAGLATALAAACDVYDESLLGAGGSGQGGGSTTSQGGGGGEPPVGCESPSECPGDDNECGTRTCVNQICGIDAVAAGTPVGQQTAGDCVQVVCDGKGQVDTVADPSDAPDDDNDCTTDSCSQGSPLHTPRAVGSLCSGAANAKVCNAEAACVECVDGGDCTSNVCTQTFSCAPASCGDGFENGSETDVDCGGSACPKCAIGDDCNVGSDCLSNVCNGTCQPSCSDGVKNQGETDIDCGGPNCGPCALGDDCSSGGDCVSGRCISQTCGEYQLVLSEIRTRGPDGGNDEILEIYNPLGFPVVLDSSFKIAGRNENAAGSYQDKWSVPANQTVTIGARRHYLIVGSAYGGGVAGNATASAGTTDMASVVLYRGTTVLGAGTTVLDAVCFYCGATNPFASSNHICEGTAFQKAATISACGNNLDQSIERKPGGAAGNGQDSNDSANDWAVVSPSNPQNLMSPATP